MADVKKGGSKLPKSEITTVRLDPKLRYLAELAARKQRRSLSSFVKWAIDDSLSRFPLREGQDWTMTVMGQAEDLWDVDPADRFAKLALRFPELLTHEEQVLWRLVYENGYFWRGSYPKGSNDWAWVVEEKGLLFQRLRQHWDELNAVVAGDIGAGVIPRAVKRPGSPPEPPKTASGFDDMDDDIPF